MSLKLWNIVKANERIKALESENEKLKAAQPADPISPTPAVTPVPGACAPVAPTAGAESSPDNDPDHDGDQHCEECNGTGMCSECMGEGTIPKKADASAPRSRHAQMAADLTTARQTIGTLQGQLEAANAAIKAKDEEIGTLKEAAKNIPGAVAQQVQIQQAKIGLPTPPTPPSTATGNSNGVSGMQRVLAASREELAKLGYTRKEN